MMSQARGRYFDLSAVPTGAISSSRPDCLFLLVTGLVCEIHGRYAIAAHLTLIAGRPVVMIPTMYTAAGLGALAGVMLGMQSSFARLTGYKENSVEAAKAGISTQSA